MGCCNQPPQGGTPQLGLLVKLIAVVAFVILLIAARFG